MVSCHGRHWFRCHHGLSPLLHKRYWRDLKKPIQIVVASGQLTRLTKAVFGQFIAIHDTSIGTHKIMTHPTVVIQAPKDATYNILLGVDFLERFKEYCSGHHQLRFLSPCGHWIISPIFPNPTVRTTIYFTPHI